MRRLSGSVLRLWIQNSLLEELYLPLERAGSKTDLSLTASVVKTTVLVLGEDKNKHPVGGLTSLSSREPYQKVHRSDTGRS